MRRAEMSGKKSWQVAMEGFVSQAEVIEGRILHVVCKGNVGLNHMEAIAATHEEAEKAAYADGGMQYVISGVSGVSGFTQKARYSYLEYLKKWYSERPLKAYIIYGANRLVRAAAYLARPFMPCRVLVTGTLEEALAIIREEEAGQYPPEQSTQSVDELLQYLGSIDWGSDGADKKEAPDPAHPFLEVFEAIRLVKKELDDVMERNRQANRQKEKVIAELKEALESNRKLKGLLPICSSCKSIRDDKGCWNQIESYIERHSEAEFSHGICPECVTKVYPNMKIS